jgi:hypothetical protein
MLQMHKNSCNYLLADVTKNRQKGLWKSTNQACHWGRILLEKKGFVMLMHMELPHRYEVVCLEEVPSSDVSQPHYRYRAAHSSDVAGDALQIQFRPQTSAPWIASFAVGTHDQSALNLVISSPDPMIAFVIVGGEGYSVQVNSPGHWHSLPVWPVMFAEVIPEQTLVVLGSGNALAVYDPKGLVWFRRVVENELKLRSISEGLIHFSGLDTEAGKTVSLSAALRSGKEVV